MLKYYIRFCLIEIIINIEINTSMHNNKSTWLSLLISHTCICYKEKKRKKVRKKNKCINCHNNNNTYFCGPEPKGTCQNCWNRVFLDLVPRKKKEVSGNINIDSSNFHVYSMPMKQSNNTPNNFCFWEMHIRNTYIVLVVPTHYTYVHVGWVAYRFVQIEVTNKLGDTESMFVWRCINENYSWQQGIKE